MTPTVKGWVRAYRVGFAALSLSAVAYQFWVGASSPSFRPVNFFSFFTIQSNLIAAAVLLWAAFPLAARWPAKTVDLVRGAAVLYLSVTGVVYGLLLAGLELQLTLPWVDTVLHRMMPLVLVFDWLTSRQVKSSSCAARSSGSPTPLTPSCGGRLRVVPVSLSRSGARRLRRGGALLRRYQPRRAAFYRAGRLCGQPLPVGFPNAVRLLTTVRRLSDVLKRAP